MFLAAIGVAVINLDWHISSFSISKLRVITDRAEVVVLATDSPTKPFLCALNARDLNASAVRACNSSTITDAQRLQMTNRRANKIRTKIN